IQDFNSVIESKVWPFRLKLRNISQISKSYSNIPDNAVNWLFDNCIEYNGFTYWNSTHVFNSGKGRTDINIGSSGILIFLSYYIQSTEPLSKKNLEKFEKAIKYIIFKKYNNQISGLFVG